MKLLSLFLAPLLLLGNAFAQDGAAASSSSPASQLPPPPWLNRAPDSSSWVITYMSGSDDSNSGTASSSDGSKKNPPKTVTVIKSGKIILEQTTDESGNTTQIWRENGNQLLRDAQGNWFVGPAVASGDPFGQADYITSDFAGFDWISADNFAGIQMISGDKCLVFKDKVLPLSAMDKGSLALNAAFDHKKVDFTPLMVDAEADIDLQTLLPVNLKIGKITRVFTYQDPPAAPLELPQDAQVALDKSLKNLAPIVQNAAGLP